ncbi:MAG: hypothetical protein CYPHOPRED_001251 [Cyphobasidiales sp. Tagirdzhanova-0007]|nr:MAG: hypothetical protein CYPHOPRED_001251 [Cyphobasidiales sp. Tagirdzhanova-0007]
MANTALQIQMNSATHNAFSNAWPLNDSFHPSEQQSYPTYPAINTWQHHFYHNGPVEKGPHTQQHHSDSYAVASTSQLPEGSPSILSYENEAEEAKLVLSGAFSSVSQVEAQPYMDEQTRDWIYPCPFCKKGYGGKHGRSIWRRHLSNKHEIPLNVQPRKTRWDNGVFRNPHSDHYKSNSGLVNADTNRPKDEAERHRRTLESKRRWAAKNRAEKRTKGRGSRPTISSLSEEGMMREPPTAYQPGFAAVQGDRYTEAGSAESGITKPRQQYYPQYSHAHLPKPHTHQPQSLTQNPSYNANFIPYERVPIHRQMSAPPAPILAPAPAPAPPDASTYIPVQHPQPQPLLHQDLFMPANSNHFLALPTVYSHGHAAPPLQRSHSAPIPFLENQKPVQANTQTDIPVEPCSQVQHAGVRFQPSMVPSTQSLQSLYSAPSPLPSQQDVFSFSLPGEMHHQLSPYPLSAPLHASASLEQATVYSCKETQAVPQLQVPSLDTRQNTGHPALLRTESKCNAAMQLLALKKDSSSPPASPTDNQDTSNMADASFADSGYGDVAEDDIGKVRKQINRRADVLPGLGSPVRQLSLPPSSSPPLTVLDKGMKVPSLAAGSAFSNKRTAADYADDNDENIGDVVPREQISLDSSPDHEQPVNRLRLATSSPSAAGDYNRAHRARSKSVREAHPSSGSAALTTPHTSSIRGRQPARRLPSTKIFELDTSSRPSASLLSSPGNFLLSSPEHAAVSRSLGLVPETGHMSTFDFSFLDGYEGGLSEYAAGVFGGGGNKNGRNEF